MLHASVTALLEALAAIERQIARLDEQRKGLARRSPVRRRLMSVPAAGPSVALSSCRRPRNKPAPSKAQRRSLSGAHH